MGAKLEPNGVKMAFEIASNFEADFEMPFSSKKVPKGSQHGSQHGAKMEPESFQEASGTQKAKNVKIALAPQREH